MNFKDLKYVGAGMLVAGVVILSGRSRKLYNAPAAPITVEAAPPSATAVSDTAVSTAARVKEPRSLALPTTESNKLPSSSPTTQPATRTVQELKVPANRVVQLTGEVGRNTERLAEQIKSLNDQSSEPIYMLINSPGGSVLSGSLLISAMQSSRAPIYTVCTAVCASMAFVTLQYGHKRYAVDRSIIMSHPASIGSASGELDKAVSFLNTLQRYVDKHNRYIANRVGVSYADFKNKSSVELWLDAEDAANDNYVDNTVYITLDGALHEDALESANLLRQLYKIPTRFDNIKLE